MVTITQIAEQKIQEFVKEQGSGVGLRLYVKGGGCSGYQYGMSFEHEIGDDDTIVEKSDSKLLSIRKAPRSYKGLKLPRSTVRRGQDSR